MRQRLLIPFIAGVLSQPLSGNDGGAGAYAGAAGDTNRIDPGSRPAELVSGLHDSPLKSALEAGARGPFQRSDFSIAHRGAPLRFPEHTRESYLAAARQGAGYVECDVTFTRDLELVCRHSPCDLHTTTNILVTELASKCSTPFTPARFDAAGRLTVPASAACCTSDLSLEEFLSLRGKADRFDASATTPEQYLGVDSGQGTLMTHRQSIELFRELGVKMIPELKKPDVEMPFKGFTREDYAQKIIDEYKEAGVPAADVRLQSFELEDILYWIEHEPAFGRRALFLDGRYEHAGFDHRNPASWDPGLRQLADLGVGVIAPPLWMLLEATPKGIVPSSYALAARAAGLEIITWSLERSGPLASGGGWYYQTLNGINPGPQWPGSGVIRRDSDMLEVLHVLARDVGVSGVFSDWPATVTYYANCMGL